MSKPVIKVRVNRYGGDLTTLHIRDREEEQLFGYEGPTLKANNLKGKWLGIASYHAQIPDGPNQEQEIEDAKEWMRRSLPDHELEFVSVAK